MLMKLTKGLAIAEEKDEHVREILELREVWVVSHHLRVRVA